MIHRKKDEADVFVFTFEVSQGGRYAVWTTYDEEADAFVQAVYDDQGNLVKEMRTLKRPVQADPRWRGPARGSGQRPI